MLRSTICSTTRAPRAGLCHLAESRREPCCAILSTTRSTTLIFRPMTASHARFVTACTELLGAQHVLTDAHDTEPYLVDGRKRYHGQACAVLLPADAEQVAAVVRLAHEHRIAIIASRSCRKAAIPDSRAARRQMRAARRPWSSSSGSIAFAASIRTTTRSPSRRASCSPKFRRAQKANAACSH